MQNQQLAILATSLFGNDAAGIVVNQSGIKRRFIPHPPSWPDGHSDQECELLERLDDVIFSAIYGNIAALEEARIMWPKLISEQGFGLVEESRTQYLRCAIDVLAQVESQEVGTLDRLTAVEGIIELLRDP